MRYPRAFQICLAALCAVCCLSLPGCYVNQWKKVCVATPAGMEWDSTRHADVKMVPYESLSLESVNAYSLKAWDVKDDQNDLAIVGRGELTTWSVPPVSDLEAAARAFGADLALAGAQQTGTAQITTRQYISSRSITNATKWSTGGEGGHANEYSTMPMGGVIGVPVQQSIPVYTMRAIFLRHVTPQERAEIDAHLSGKSP